MRRPTPVAATVVAFVLGSGLLVPFESPLTLVAGVLLLFTAVVLGVFAIASPDYLARGPDDSELPR